MAPSRREFIKFAVVGSVAAGCPIDETLFAATDSKAPGDALVHGEHFEICHQLRDGLLLDRLDAEQKADIVIVGGGVAGLSAAYFLRGKDWLLLEKEPLCGGNALQEEFEGQIYGTGSAYAYHGDEGDQLASEIGLKMPFVNMPDPTIVNKTYVPDTWKTGLEQLPYPKAVRESFKKFRDEMMKIKVREKIAELDAQPFSNFTAAYAPEVQQWWDGFGPSNWGAVTEDSSASLATPNLQHLITRGAPTRPILPGGLGCITHQLVEVLAPKYQERKLDNAAAVAVVQDKDPVRLTYVHPEQLITVTARIVLLCT